MKVFGLMSKVELIAEEGNITFGLIQDIVDNKLYVSIPPDDKQFRLLQNGDAIKCIVYNNNKVLGFGAVVTNRIPGILPIYELSSNDNFEIIQRREYVRVNTILDIRYTDNKYLLEINNNNYSKTKEIIQNIDKYLKSGLVSDVSGGGLRFSCEESLNQGNKLLIVFEISKHVFIVKGEIVYKDINVSPNRTIYTYGIKFLNISEKNRERIINYVFLLMRKNKLR